MRASSVDRRGRFSNSVPPHDRPLLDRLCIGCGLLMLLHFAYAAWVKHQTGMTAELMWWSYVSLALGSLGLMVRSVSLLAVVFAGLLVPHGIWLIDAISGMTTGTYPLRTAGYLAHATTAQWIATAHHFYMLPVIGLLMPLLARRVHPQRLPTGKSLVISCMAIMIGLTVVSRIMLPPVLNVNFAFAVFPRMDEPMVHAINSLAMVPYLFVLNLLWLAMVVVPGRMITLTMIRLASRLGPTVFSPPYSSPILSR